MKSIQSQIRFHGIDRVYNVVILKHYTIFANAFNCVWNMKTEVRDSVQLGVIIMQLHDDIIKMVGGKK